MKTNKCFYRNEVEDYFQYNPPSDFRVTSYGTIEPNKDEEGIFDIRDGPDDRIVPPDGLFNLLSGVVEGNDGTVSWILIALLNLFFIVLACSKIR
jgi:hypothetical protein